VGVSKEGKTKGKMEEGEKEKGHMPKAMNIQDLVHDVECGIKVLSQVMKAGWWDWKFGSALFFWRWNSPEQIRAARDGIRIYMSLLPSPHSVDRHLPRLAHALNK
jgi:hypothetical protein